MRTELIVKREISQGYSLRKDQYKNGQRPS